jgi:hypothetical protein
MLAPIDLMGRSPFGHTDCVSSKRFENESELNDSYISR